VYKLNARLCYRDCTSMQMSGLHTMMLLVCSLSNVVRIERVQNPHLWTKYCLRRHEVELAAGSQHVNEQFLFHGCRKDIMAVISNEGFDIRVAGMQGSLGAGTYFAGTGSNLDSLVPYLASH